MGRRFILITVLLTGLMGGAVRPAGGQVRIGQAAPDIAGEPWINSRALTMDGLRGRVVLVELG